MKFNNSIMIGTAHMKKNCKLYIIVIKKKRDTKAHFPQIP